MKTGEPIRIGIVGAGQIAKVQHIPAIAASAGFRLTAIANPVPVDVPDGVTLFPSIDAMIEAGIVDAVSICTPPQIRYGLARTAIAAGLHVLLEKPPAQTVSEVEDLATRAAASGRTLFAAWHSMFSAAVEPARRILAERGVSAMHIVWKEDFEKFHPGVYWFWQPGGMGTFDSGVNALSILVGSMPEPVFVRGATFHVRDGAHTPISATLQLATPSHADGFSAVLDWNHAGEETWSITWTLGDGGTLELEQGGRILRLDGRMLLDAGDNEYPALYRHFETLIDEGRSDAETRPLQLAADAFSLARIERV
ncbi:Gfo/Idh/MocA family oxidoreductase [Lichenicola cladoniae]|uniref:Gfo/Idh/MocA family oxidoreductase n=1 Tax=Lichenicola cladoniae TaxID=1484109 RepID=A0A6M8HNT0_9PROT|nr:Gfo/Idh/MocA family oxidoreductase [Lichenicola cladoniae]NPD67449.1 Gfo/Idh/MocA family oxidoreductase [Acetobacteraceae bacterium]QKE89937.1 Gfo/Idh/MocA family oxidoreductase [Lichenicola cladoniae]